MKNLLKKFSSRKFLTAAAGIIVGVVVALGSADEGVISTIAGAAMSVISLVVYIITEGRVDAAAVALASQAAQDVGDAVEAVQAVTEAANAKADAEEAGEAKAGEVAIE